MRLLDLFCGAGGAAEGYHRAGFDRILGIDLADQGRYPFNFYRADALEVLDNLRDFGEFDAIHASPPCQAYSVLRRANPGTEYPDLIAPVRDRLERSGLPWIIENVPGSPLRDPIVLCGSMFGLGAGDRQLRRHRLFESNLCLLAPECDHRGEAIGVYGGGAVGRYTFDHGGRRDYYQRRGGYQGTMAEKREAMGISWMVQREISQAIPPAYTEFVGRQLIAALERAA